MRAALSSGVIGIMPDPGADCAEIALATAGATTVEAGSRRRSGDARLDDLDIDLRDLRQPDRHVLVEVALLERPVLQRQPFGHDLARAPQRRTLDLGSMFFGLIARPMSMAIVSR